MCPAMFAVKLKQLPENAGEINLEDMDPAEVGAPSYPYTKVRNTWFDVTPVALLRGWVNEDTVIDYARPEVEERNQPPSK